MKMLVPNVGDAPRAAFRRQRLGILLGVIGSAVVVLCLLLSVPCSCFEQQRLDQSRLLILRACLLEYEVANGELPQTLDAAVAGTPYQHLAVERGSFGSDLCLWCALSFLLFQPPRWLWPLLQFGSSC